MSTGQNFDLGLCNLIDIPASKRIFPDDLHHRRSDSLKRGSHVSPCKRPDGKEIRLQIEANRKALIRRQRPACKKQGAEYRKKKTP